MYVDGESLQQELASFALELDVQQLDFDYGSFFSQFGAERVYYYDAWPQKKENETGAEFSERWQSKESLFALLNRTPKVHVRTGTTRWSRRQGQRQKAVDVLLAVDVVTHALKGVTERVAMLLSDLDFYPVFETLLHTSVKTHLIFRSKHTVDDLIEVADYSFRLTRTTILNGCESNFAARYRSIDDSSSGPLTDDERANFAIGQCRGIEIYVGREPNGSFVGYCGGVRSRSKSRDLVIERLVNPALEVIHFSDGTTYP